MKFALSSLLVPEPLKTPRDGWTTPSSDFDGSMPATLDLGNGLKGRLVFPMGLARTIRVMPAAAVASDSADQFATYPSVLTGSLLDPMQPRPKLIVRDANGTIGTAPLVAGQTFDLGWSETSRLKVMVEFLGWKFAVGNLREKGRYGSQLQLAFKRADQASASFNPPPVHPYVAMRDAHPIVIQSLMILLEAAPLVKRGRRRMRAK